MMSRGEFLKGYLQRRRNTMQKADRVHATQAGYFNCAVSAIDGALARYQHAQNDLEEALMQESDFLYDRFVELEGSLIIPSRPSTGSEPVRQNGTLMDGREPRSTESL